MQVSVEYCTMIPLSPHPFSCGAPSPEEGPAFKSSFPEEVFFRAWVLGIAGPLGGVHRSALIELRDNVEMMKKNSKQSTVNYFQGFAHSIFFSATWSVGEILG